MKKKRIKHVVICLGILLAAAGILWAAFMPKRDRISVEQLPESYFVENEANYVAFQSGSDCSGYATAYVLRHLGIKADGPSIYKEIPQIMGKPSLGCIRSVLKKYGFRSAAYYGTIDTLKAQLVKGTPVIAFVTITIGSEHGLHYVAVAGYDKDYIYLADSTGRKTNVVGNNLYNRKVTYEEFEELWQTDIYPMNNLYIAILNEDKNN